MELTFHLALFNQYRFWTYKYFDKRPNFAETLTYFYNSFL